MLRGATKGLTKELNSYIAKSLGISNQRVST